MLVSPTVSLVMVVFKLVVLGDNHLMQPEEKCLHHVSPDHPKERDHQQQAAKPKTL